MRTLLLLAFLLTITTYSNAYNSRVVPLDTIPDTTQVKPSTGSGASSVSVISGIGSSLFGAITSSMFLVGSIDRWGGVFPIGWVIGLVGIISGIVGLSLNRKMPQSDLTEEGKNKVKKIKRRSIAGIIFSIIGIGITIIMIAFDSSFV